MTFYVIFYSLVLVHFHKNFDNDHALEQQSSLDRCLHRTFDSTRMFGESLTGSARRTKCPQPVKEDLDCSLQCIKKIPMILDMKHMQISNDSWLEINGVVLQTNIWVEHGIKIETDQMSKSSFTFKIINYSCS